MRQHPISPVTEPMQYRAIGVVRGTYVPEDPDQLTRGTLQAEDGTEIEAVVLGRVLTLMRRHLDLSKPHLWVAYPRFRDPEKLHLQLVGDRHPERCRGGGRFGSRRRPARRGWILLGARRIDLHPSGRR